MTPIPNPQKTRVQRPRGRQRGLQAGVDPYDSPFLQLKTDLKTLFAGQIYAHSTLNGCGTDVTGYSLPQDGPFRCDHCGLFDEPNLCDHPKVIADPDVPKSEDGSHALVKPDACCNLFHPVDEDQDNDNDEDDK
jgi:hypothetical protein